MRTTIGEFLFRRLREIGVAHVLGVPGDYNLQLLEQVEAVEGIAFVGTCNELNAAYAADGYARLNGVSALLTTYGVGELSAINGVAGASAEHVPVVCITGSPPLHATQGRWLLHHSLADGDFDNTLTCYRQFTIAQARLTPANAAEEIDRVLRACLREKRPVYLQLPSDISYLTIEVPDAPLAFVPPASEPEQLRRAVAQIRELIERAHRPALLIDMDADRFHLGGRLSRLSEKAGIPYAALSTGKCILDESGPRWLGLYGGRNSPPAVRERIENSDCLIVTAPRFIEGNSGLFSQQLPEASTISIGGLAVTIAGQTYAGISACELLDELIATVSPDTRVAPAAAETAEPEAFSATDGAALTQARLWPQVARFIREGDVVVAEAGTSNIGLTGTPMPAGVSYITANIWGSIGYTLPALLGTLLAAPAHRQLLFIGDGSFQLTAQELSTILRLDLKPVIFLLNNRGYTIERFILGMHASYNDVADWKYANLPAVFADASRVLTAQVRTEDELAGVLGQLDAWEGAAFIEVHLEPFDAPQGLKTFGPVTAEFDYGPRGPQAPAETTTN